MTLVKAKGWAKSRLIWVGALMIALGAQALLMEQDLLGTHTDTALTALGFIVVWLRAMTDKPLSTHPTKPDVKEVEAPAGRLL